MLENSSSWGESLSCCFLCGSVARCRGHGTGSGQLPIPRVLPPKAAVSDSPEIFAQPLNLPLNLSVDVAGWQH